MLFSRRVPASLPTADQTLPGRAEAMPIHNTHLVHGRPIQDPPPDGFAEVHVGLGCFWGAERLFWNLEGVYTTAVGYGGGHTPNPTYREVCSGRTAHTELVRVVYDPAQITLEAILKVFWEAHDPTQGMRQGNDVGTQYRSAIYWTAPAQRPIIEASQARYAAGLQAAKKGEITTQLAAAGPFYYAEDEHQQYLAKNPGGYCGLAGTGVTCPLSD